MAKPYHPDFKAGDRVRFADVVRNRVSSKVELIGRTGIVYKFSNGMLHVTWDKDHDQICIDFGRAFFAYRFEVIRDLDMDRPVYQREGKKIPEVISVAKSGERPIKARVFTKDGESMVLSFQKNGLFYKDIECPIDLVNR